MQFLLRKPAKPSSTDTNLEQQKKNQNSQYENSDSLLLEDIDIAKKDIETLLLHLDYQTDPDMIDCYSYQLKGAYMKYKFLLRQLQRTTNC